MTTIVSKKALFLLVYLTSFLYSFQYALPLYIESSFISQFLSSEKVVGLIFSFAAIFTVTYTFLLPRILRRFGNYKATLGAMGVEIIALIILAFCSDPSTSPTLAIISFIVFLITSAVIFLNLDYFVENFTDNEKTGSMRGIFMTVLNIAVAVAPFVAGLMLTDHDFWKIWAAAAVIMSLGFFVIAKYFRNYEDPHYLVHPFRSTFRIVRESHDLHSIILMHFLLSFFFVWMVIYTPIYLNTYVGIPMNEILSTIIPIALLPFVLFEVIFGRLADTKYGEKEMLTIGFVIMGISTAAIAWTTTTNIYLWAGLLFATRFGASAVEAMTESYFYKKVGPEDAHLITFMRTMRATSYIIAPIIGSVLLMFIDFRFLFLVLGILMLAATPYSLTIKDTK